MNESERPSTPATPERVWRSMDEKEEIEMDITFTPDQLCAMARSRERLNLWGRRIVLILLVGFVGVLAHMIVAVGRPSHSVFPVSQVWARLGIGWYLAWTCLLTWGVFHRRPRRMRTTECCAGFLQREFEAKRRGLLATQRYLLLVMLPPILVFWWTPGMHALRLSRLNALGLDPSSRLYEFASGPWAFIIILCLLALDWFAFGLAAKKAAWELEDLRRRVQE